MLFNRLRSKISLRLNKSRIFLRDYFLTQTDRVTHRSLRLFNHYRIPNFLSQNANAVKILIGGAAVLLLFHNWRSVLKAFFHFSMGFSVFLIVWKLLLNGRLRVVNKVITNSIANLDRKGVININVDRFVLFHKKVVQVREGLKILYVEAMKNYYEREIIRPSDEELDRNLPFVMDNVKLRGPLHTNFNPFFFLPFDDNSLRLASKSFHDRIAKKAISIAMGKNGIKTKPFLLHNEFNWNRKKNGIKGKAVVSHWDERKGLSALKDVRFDYNSNGIPKSVFFR